MSKRKKWIITGLATACFVTAVALSHRIEPGVSVQKVTLADDTPALKFLPAGPEPHPVALLAHAGWKARTYSARFKIPSVGVAKKS